MELSPQQADRLERAHSEIGSILLDLQIIDKPQEAIAEPQWMRPRRSSGSS